MLATRPWLSLENHPVPPERPLAGDPGQVSLSEPLFSPPSAGNTNSRFFTSVAFSRDAEGTAKGASREGVPCAACPLPSGRGDNTGCHRPLAAMWGGGCVACEALACSWPHRRRGAMAPLTNDSPLGACMGRGGPSGAHGSCGLRIPMGSGS